MASRSSSLDPEEGLWCTRNMINFVCKRFLLVSLLLGNTFARARSSQCGARSVGPRVTDQPLQAMSSSSEQDLSQGVMDLISEFVDLPLGMQ